MNLSMVLVHSPSVGPSTWMPCRRALELLGVHTLVPDLRQIGVGGPPYWPRIAAIVGTAMGQLEQTAPVVLVAHSNAGLFLPTIVEASPRPVAAVVLVDAGMPVAPGPVPVAPAEFLSWLRSLAGADGRLPRWTDWWSAEDLAATLPDPRVRQEIVADQPRLPLDYFEQAIPVPASWAAAPGAYLQFTPGYADDAARATAAGWPVEQVRGEHLHQAVDPIGVAGAIHRLQALTRGA